MRHLAIELGDRARPLHGLPPLGVGRRALRRLIEGARRVAAQVAGRDWRETERPTQCKQMRVKDQKIMIIRS
jgi:hypothetical protein